WRSRFATDDGYRPRPPSASRPGRPGGGSSSEPPPGPPPARDTEDADICSSLMSRAAFDDLRQRLAEIADLGKTAALLSWDQQVMMPSGGAAIRAEQLATVGRIAHTKFISPEIGRLLDDLHDFGEQHEYDSFEASLVRVARRDWE